MTDGAEGLAGAAIPTRTLAGEEEGSYVAALGAVLRAARLNSQYPDARLLCSHLRALSPEVHRGLYPGLEADLRSGLPSYKEWTRVQTDVRIASEQLVQLGPREALELRARRSPGSQVHHRQLLKHHYYSDLASVQLAPLGEMKAVLRKVEPEARLAHFHLVLDKLDVTGTFVRYSIDLAQPGASWAAQGARPDEEVASHADALRSLVYKFTSYDAELTFVKLATLGGLSVERVVKGVIGPACFPWVRAPEPLRPLLGPCRVVALFALDLAATDLAADRDNDPFDDLMLDRLSPEARQGYEQSRKHLGYKVFKDRKFVASADLVEPLRRLCAAQRTRNVIYPL